MGFEESPENIEIGEKPVDYFEGLSRSAPGGRKTAKGVLDKRIISVFFKILLILLLFFLFIAAVVRFSRSDGKNESSLLKSRLEKIEDRLSRLEEMSAKGGRIDISERKIELLTDRMGRLEADIMLQMNVMARKVVNLEKAMHKIPHTTIKKRVKITKKRNTVEKKDHFKFYRVKQGENLYRIGKKYNIAVSELMRVNKINKGRSIYPGQKLRIPVR